MSIVIIIISSSSSIIIIIIIINIIIIIIIIIVIVEYAVMIYDSHSKYVASVIYPKHVIVMIYMFGLWAIQVSTVNCHTKNCQTKNLWVIIPKALR